MAHTGVVVHVKIDPKQVTRTAECVRAAHPNVHLPVFDPVGRRAPDGSDGPSGGNVVYGQKGGIEGDAQITRVDAPPAGVAHVHVDSDVLARRRRSVR